MSKDGDKNEGKFTQNKTHRSWKSARTETVTMESDTKHKVDPIPGHYDALEREYSANSEAESTPFTSDAAV